LKSTHGRESDIKHAAPEGEQGVPSLAQYKRVQSILESDRALRKKLGPSTAINRGETSARFPNGVIKLTEALHTEGLNLKTLKPKIVLARGVDFLVLGRGAAACTENMK